MKRNRQKRDLESGSETAPIASPDTDVENFGPWLKQQREVREIEAREVADASKISVRYIEALETNRFDVLPAAVFTKGFLRQYAIYVGLDPEEVVNYYLAALRAQRDQEEPDPELTPRPRGSRNTSAKWLVAALIVGAVLISVVWLLFTLSDRVNLGGIAGGSAVESAAPSSPTASRPSSSGSVADTPVDGDDGARAERSSPSTESANPRASTSLATPDPELNDTLSTGASDPGSSGAPIPAGAPPAVEPSLAESSAPLLVVIDFSGDCWVEATIDQGRRLAEMRVQGESLRLEAQRQLQIKLGDVRVAEILVNGMPYSVEPNPGSSVVDLQLDLQTVAGLRAANGNVRDRLE